MAGFSLKLKLDMAAAVEALATIRTRGLATRPAMQAIGEHLRFATDRRFETETAPDGARWKPSRRALKEGGQTLTDTARLRQSIDVEATDDTMRIGTNLPYGRMHQLGGEIQRQARTQTIFRMYNARTDELGRRFVNKSRSNFATEHAVGAHVAKMPARPFLGIGAADRPEIATILGEFVAYGQLPDGPAGAGGAP